MIDLPRRTYYYRPTQAGKPLNDPELTQLIGDIYDVFPGYGYRRIILELKTRGHVVNHKRIARVMRENDLHTHRRRRFKPVAGSGSNLAVFPNLYRNTIPAEPDRVWLYIPCGSSGC